MSPPIIIYVLKYYYFNLNYHFFAAKVLYMRTYMYICELNFINYCL